MVRILILLLSCALFNTVYGIPAARELSLSAFVVESGENKTLRYDRNGNLFTLGTSQGTITNMWDAADRCVAIQSTSSNRVEMVY